MVFVIVFPHADAVSLIKFWGRWKEIHAGQALDPDRKTTAEEADCRRNPSA